jgi:serine/threonine protein kinase
MKGSQSGCALDHPAVVKAFTDDKRSRVYMVTEWVEGRLLRQIIGEEGKLPIERAVRIALRICSGAM